MYLAYALFVEGSSDRQYFDILLPRVLESLAQRFGKRRIDIPDRAAIILGESGRKIECVAQELCKTREAFHIAFIHADVGGAAVSASLEDRSAQYCRRAHEKCGFPCECCVIVSPKKEMEAWALADPEAIAKALGLQNVDGLSLPRDGLEAERLEDPKHVLDQASARAVGRRKNRPKAAVLLPAIAREQDLALLRRSSSFKSFEARIKATLKSLQLVN